jgi:hypothetical protein
LDDKPAKEAVLPHGVNWNGDELVLDAKYRLLRVSPSLALVVEPDEPESNTATLRLAAGGSGGLWVACNCAAGGGCQVDFRPGPGGDKGTVVCISKGCTGGCKLSSRFGLCVAGRHRRTD